MNFNVCYMQAFFFRSFIFFYLVLFCWLSTVVCGTTEKYFLCRFIFNSLSLSLPVSFHSVPLVTLDDEYIIKLSAISLHLHLVQLCTIVDVYLRLICARAVGRTDARMLYFLVNIVSLLDTNYSMPLSDITFVLNVDRSARPLCICWIYCCLSFRRKCVRLGVECNNKFK